MTHKGSLFFLFVVCLLSSKSIAQPITVVDKISQQRIPGVKVFSLTPKVQVLTKTNGIFELSQFKGCDSLYISYPNYEKIGLTVQEVKKLGYIELAEHPLSVSEMTVTGNRWEEDQVKNPGRISKLNMREAELLAPQTTADLLETSGYVFIQKSQLAGGSPQMRGFGTNRVMIVVDGVRMNNAIFRSGNLQNVISLDANSLDGVEVLFGPGAVMYGSDAIGGVMNFQTKRAQFTPDSLKSYTHTNVFTRYSTASNELTTHLDFNIGLKKWSFLSSLTYAQYDDLKTGEFGDTSFLRQTYQTTINNIDSTVLNADPRKQIYSGFSQLNAMQKIQFRPNDNLNFDYGFYYSTTSIAPRYDRLLIDKDDDGNLDYAEWFYGPQEWMMNKLSLVHTPKTGAFYNDLRINIAYQKYEESRHDRKFASNIIRRQFEKVDAVSLNIDLDKKVGARTQVFYGLEGIFNRVSSKAYHEDINSGTEETINPRYPNGSTWQSYGAFLNLKYMLSDKWIAHIGGRYSQYIVHADFDTTLFPYPVSSTKNSDNALNGSVGIVFNPNERLQLYTNFATGFRAPNLDDIGKVFDSQPGNVIVPNVNLKPEYAYNSEFGFVKAFKNILKIDGAVYYTFLKDALARGDFHFNGQDSIVYEGVMSNVQAVQNISNAYVYGVQGGVEFVFGKGFSAKSTISYQKGFDYNLDSARYYPKPHIAPLFGRTSISYKVRRLSLELYAIYQGEMTNEDIPLVDKQDPIFAKDEDGKSFVPSWYTINFKVMFYMNKHIAFNAGVENITNQLYRTMGSGISAPGRNFMIAIKANF